MERQFTQRARKGNTRVGTLTYKQYAAGRERGLLVVGGAEKASMVKGNISHLGVPESWEEGRPEMEEERLKYREIEDHQGGWRESILTGNRWQRKAEW